MKVFVTSPSVVDYLEFSTGRARTKNLLAMGVVRLRKNYGLPAQIYHSRRKPTLENPSPIQNAATIRAGVKIDVRILKTERKPSPCF